MVWLDEQSPVQLSGEGVDSPGDFRDRLELDLLLDEVVVGLRLLERGLAVLPDHDERGVEDRFKGDDQGERGPGDVSLCVYALMQRSHFPGHRDGQCDELLRAEVQRAGSVVAHGEHDTVIPRERLARTWDYLLGPSGAQIVARRDLVGHTIAAPALSTLASWVQERTA